MILPSDKSLTHRAVLFAAMIPGEHIIEGPLQGDDCLRTLHAIELLGVKVKKKNNAWEISSRGISEWVSPIEPIDCGNSGTTARMLLGILSSVPGLFSILYGDSSLSRRPMRRVIEPLKKMGANIVARSDHQFLPCAILGEKLSGKKIKLEIPSAQLKSALLLSGLNASGKTEITLPMGSRDHTEKMLEKLNFSFKKKASHTHEILTVEEYKVVRQKNIHWAIPKDPSSAAYWACLQAVMPKGKITLRNVLNNSTRLGFLKYFDRAGVRYQKIENKKNDSKFPEPVMDLVVWGGSELKAADITREEIPSLIDEIPVLSLVSVFAHGVSKFHGLSELRVKESDRLEKICELLNLIGARAKIIDDDLKITGPLKKINAFAFDPEGDHRLCMVASIFAKLSKKDCHVKDKNCVKVSYPNFFDHMGEFR